jgi:hypothetical protein
MRDQCAAGRSRREDLGELAWAHRRWLVSIALCLTMAVGGCLAARPTPGDPAARARVEAGHQKKTWSVVSFADQTVVRDTPSASDTTPGFDAERVWSGVDDWEPAIASDPYAPYVYHLTTRHGGPKPCSTCAEPAIIFRRSNDGGATWSPDQFLAVARRSQHDPQSQATDDGAICVAWLHSYHPGVTFMKSWDHGDSWSVPVAVVRPQEGPSWSDKPLLVSSRDGKDVYIAFNASHSYVVASHDAGESFPPPVETNSDRRYWFHTGGAVAPNGDVYFAATDYGQDYRGDVHINVLQSTDGGVSWRTMRLDTSQEAPDCAGSARCPRGFLGPSAALAIDGAGQMALVHAGGTPGGAQQLYVRTSLDGDLE